MHAALFPIIVPRTYFGSGSWPGPHLRLRHPELAVTWVELSAPTTMAYVTFERVGELESMGIRIHETAMENLRKASEQLLTHGRESDDGLVLGAMMHPDGLGTSRLLLLSQIELAFPAGALLGIPERSCGFVVSTKLSPAEMKEALDMVSSYYRDGTTPMLDGLHEPRLFAIVDA